MSSAWRVFRLRRGKALLCQPLLFAGLAFMLLHAARFAAFGDFVEVHPPEWVEAEGGADEAGSSAGHVGESKPPDLWFPVGERLLYGIRWAFFRVGTAEIVSEWIEEHGRELLAINIDIKATPFFYRIYRVEGRIESVIDPVPFTPLRFTQRTRAGRHRAHEKLSFDHEAGTALWTDVRTGEKEETAIEPDTRCPASLMYYLRSKEFDADTVYNLKVMADEKVRDVELRAGDYETISLRRFGDLRSLSMETEVSFRGLPARVDNLQVWVSDDERVLCAKASARTMLGTVAMVLEDVKGPGADAWSRGGGDVDQ